MSKTKVRLTVKSWRQKVGDEIEVDAETAERLVANRQASYVSAKKQAEAQPGA